MSAEMLGRGRALGRYTLKRPLGAGGNGQVFLAWQSNATPDPLIVVVKLCYAHDARSEKAAGRSLKEAAMAMRLGRHPNIVQVTDVDVFEGMPFIVMEYVDGADLETVLATCRRRGKGLELPAIYEIIAGTAVGLHHAHFDATWGGARVGIVHRDIKPANLLLTRDGLTKIADFGIGVVLEDGTTGQHIRGTSRYMSIEHLRCEVRPEMDIYSLGVVAWEMVENRVFRDACRGMEHYPRIMDGDIPPMLNPHTPELLVALIEACLDPEPGQRPTALDVLNWLPRCPGYARDPKHVRQVVEAVRGTRRSSGASAQHLAATPELVATFVALGQPWASEDEPPQCEPEVADDDDDHATVAMPARPVLGGRPVDEASPGGTVESAESVPVPPEPTVLEAEPDAPKLFRRPWANRVREINKTIKLKLSVGTPADARAERIKTPPLVEPMRKAEERVQEARPAAEVEPPPAAEVEPPPAAEVEARPAAEVEARPAAEVEPPPAAEVEAPSAAEVETRPAAEVEARPSRGTKAPSAVRFFLVPILASLAASVVATVLTAQQLGSRDEKPRAAASATPTLAAHEAALVAELDPSSTMRTEPEASSARAQVPAASGSGEALASSVASEAPMDAAAEQASSPLPPSEAVSNTAPEPSAPDARPELPDAPATATESPSPPTESPAPVEPLPTSTKPSPPATLTLTLFLLDTAEVQIGRKTAKLSRKTQIEVPAGTHRVRWRLPGEDYWRDAGRRKFVAGHSYLVRVRESTAPEIIDTDGARP